jgi:hypothetical protein
MFAPTAVTQWRTFERVVAMFKSIGLGICCLTLSISGVTRATVISVDNGKYGDDQCLKIDIGCKSDLKCVDFKPVIGGKDDCKISDKDNCDLKLIIDCHDTGKDGKDICKLNWTDTHDHLLCDIGNKDCNDNHGHDCDLLTDHCNSDPCGDHCSPPCDPVAVPAPASAEFGGLGVFGMMLFARLRSRRSAAV